MRAKPGSLLSAFTKYHQPASVDVRLVEMRRTRLSKHILAAASVCDELRV
jgi:hypothetical protein